MKVGTCKKCKHFSRKVWTQYYVPKDYHPIGMNHAYAFCDKHQKRCLDIRGCKQIYEAEGGDEE